MADVIRLARGIWFEWTPIADLWLLGLSINSKTIFCKFMVWRKGMYKMKATAKPSHRKSWWLCALPEILHKLSIQTLLLKDYLVDWSLSSIAATCSKESSKRIPPMSDVVKNLSKSLGKFSGLLVNIGGGYFWRHVRLCVVGGRSFGLECALWGFE
jgi:hypothetical protein